MKTLNQNTIRLFCFLNVVILTLTACGEDNSKVFQVELLDYFSEGSEIKMINMPGGTFLRGGVAKLSHPAHFVTLSPFMISATEITQEQYQAVMGVNPSRFYGSADLPVESVSWYDAADFCNALSERMGLAKCYGPEYSCAFDSSGFRLPTEAEWEYAAKAGGGGEAWCNYNSENKTVEVATNKPNGAGLFDMRGNVFEWCNDYFSLYKCNAQKDPTGPESGGFKVLRGGSWASSPNECEATFRYTQEPVRALSFQGFRIVRRTNQ